MSDLMEILANLFIYWPKSAVKKIRVRRSLRGIAFRKMPVINAAKKRAASEDQHGPDRF